MITMSLVLQDTSPIIFPVPAIALFPINWCLDSPRIDAVLVLQNLKHQFAANFGLTSNKAQQIQVAVEIPD